MGLLIDGSLQGNAVFVTASASKMLNNLKCPEYHQPISGTLIGM